MPNLVRIPETMQWLDDISAMCLVNVQPNPDRMPVMTLRLDEIMQIDNEDMAIADQLGDTGISHISMKVMEVIPDTHTSIPLIL